MDFGIARAVADSAATMTQTSAVLGTAQYLSPEQARGEVVDARSDLYSTGCLLYELLTGRPPFVGDSPVSVAYQHVRETPSPPSTLNPDVPVAVDAVVMKSLQKRPGRPVRDGSRHARGPGARAPGPAARRCARPDGVVPVAVVPVPDLRPGLGRDPGHRARCCPGRARRAPDGPQQPQSRAGWFYILALAVVGALVLAFFLGRAIFGGTTDNIAVPNVVGLTQAEATAQLQRPRPQARHRDAAAERHAGRRPCHLAGPAEGPDGRGEHRPWTSWCPAVPSSWPSRPWSD